MKGDEFLMMDIDWKAGLEASIFRGMERYALKMEKQANVVVLNPADLNGQALDCVGIEVQAMKNVLPGTLWVGRAEEKTDNDRREEDMQEER